MAPETLFLIILLPFIAGILQLVWAHRSYSLRGCVTLFATALLFWIAVRTFGQEGSFHASWGGFGFHFTLRLYHFSSFILLFIALFAFLIAIYAVSFMSAHKASAQFFAYYLFTVAMANGAVLANDLITLLFFWEGLLLTLFGLIVIGHPGAYRTAIKAFIINGVADLCMLAGMMLTASLSHTTTLSSIHLQLGGLASLAFILFAVGALGKSGSMPFQSWIPDAAEDAPLPFMALIPGAFEKLLGIYLLTRICLDFFVLSPGSRLSLALMILGSLTILLAVLMALVQKDYKRLLSFHAISQVGYMILGIGTAVPAGIVGGLFHMLNNALYKSCLFLTGGAVEHQTGTTDLRKLGGLRAKMPLTFLGFAVAAVSISGVPPFNGFFSKELIYDGALERGVVFYLAAVLGSFLTAASFLKLGHAAYFGKSREATKDVKEPGYALLLPILALAAICIVFGVYNPLPLREFIQPVLGSRLHGHDFAGLPHSVMLIAVTILVLAAAVANHFYGVKRSGSGLGAVDHIHYAPGFHSVYSRAEKRYFDPYELAMKAINGCAYIGHAFDRIINWVYDRAAPAVCLAAAALLRGLHTGNHAVYLAWSVLGAAVVIVVCMYG